MCSSMMGAGMSTRGMGLYKMGRVSTILPLMGGTGSPCIYFALLMSSGVIAQNGWSMYLFRSVDVIRCNCTVAEIW